MEKWKMLGKQFGWTGKKKQGIRLEKAEYDEIAESRENMINK